MKKNVVIIFTFCILQNTYAQHSDTLNIFRDTASLDNITVTAFSAQAKWKDAPLSVAILNNETLHHFDNTSLVPSMNTIAGVRMEERSPGSYRLSIRGSLLRSPFGIRNIKIYWDDIPLTDATGNTYLNLISLTDLEYAEIIKGPASSYYGANTGGALILHSDYSKPYKKNILTAGISGGSFGMFAAQAGWHAAYKNFISELQISHLQNNGYRQQSALQKDVLKWNSRMQLSAKESLSILGFYSSLHYETPGGITEEQMIQDPKLARQPTQTLPGSVEQHAGIYNKTLFAAASLKSAFSTNFGNTTSLMLNHTDFKNPFITNYEKRNEWNYSARTDFYYTVRKSNFTMQANAGGELQYNQSGINVFGNEGGYPDTVQYRDKVHTTQYFLFAQLTFNIGKNITIQTGASTNELRYWYTRTTDPEQKMAIIKTTGSLVSPRLSALYKLTDQLSLYTILSKGFSPPTLAEVLPSTGNFSSRLKPEYGWNYEAGIKGAAFTNRLQYDVSFYYFALKDAIVSKRDSTGADYFINAGSTIQKGFEAWLNGFLIKNNNHFITQLSLHNSFTYQPYRFQDYEAAGVSYSGNKLTGVPRIINVSGLDIKAKHGFYVFITYNYTGSLPLNDANSVYAKPYRLLDVKLGKDFVAGKTGISLYAGANNLLNEVYSLGNDINAFGGRYYNPAPERNYYAGIALQF